MAIKLTSKPNTDAPDVTYPFGKIRDNTGSGDGTPVNTVVYGDIHQFFEKLMEAAGIVHNDLPDNVSAGFQLFTALQSLIQAAVAVITHSQVDKSIAVSYDSLLNSINDLDDAKKPGIGHFRGDIANSPVGFGVTDGIMLIVADTGNSGLAHLLIHLSGSSGAGPGTHYTRTYNGISDVWSSWTQL